MNIQPYVALLSTNAPSLEQVIEATPGVKALSVDTVVELMAVLDPALSGQVFNLVLEQDPVYPNLVFQLVSSQPQSVDGFHLYQADTYHLYIRDRELNSLRAVVAQVRSDMEASSWAIDVEDMLYDYDDEQSAYRANIEITFTVLAMPGQTLPAAIVYPVNTSAGESRLVNRVHQREEQAFSVMLVDTASNMEPIRREVQAALLGKQVSAQHEPIEYRQGAALDGGGPLSLWHELYKDALYIAES
ncbi:MAG: hypothetical protein JAY88_14760 [Candidatus Thiodiazotropha lotti]|nr:hypothetical protein [Candidatus Thiodiazotropha lotti]MCW4188325.1 hypothetical protein [Candidatus Thiodiazotropha lotti]